MVRFLISAAFEDRRLLEKYGKKNILLEEIGNLRSPRFA